MTTVHESLVSLRKVVDRLDDVLVPWGFLFHPGENDYASAGEYANGYYLRGPIRIVLIWRARIGLGCVSYELEEVLQQGYLRERITWGIGHPRVHANCRSCGRLSSDREWNIVIRS